MTYADFERQTLKPYAPPQPVVKPQAAITPGFAWFLATLMMALILGISLPAYAGIVNQAQQFDEVITREELANPQWVWEHCAEGSIEGDKVMNADHCEHNHSVNEEMDYQEAINAGNPGKTEVKPNAPP